MSYIYNINSTGLQQLGKITLRGSRPRTTRNLEGDFSNNIDIVINTLTGLEDRFQRPTGTVIFESVSTLSISGGGFTGHFIPTSNNAYDVGSSSFLVRSIYANNISTNTESVSGDLNVGGAVNGTGFLGANATYASTTKLNLTAGVGWNIQATTASMRLYDGTYYVDLQPMGFGHLQIYNTTTPTNPGRLTIPNTYTSASNGEWLRLDWTNNTGYVRAVASGAGIQRSMMMEAGSGTGLTTFGVTPNGSLFHNRAPVAATGNTTHKLAINLSGTIYYLLASSNSL